MDPLDQVLDFTSGDETDIVFEKVENYLRACRLSSKLTRSRLSALFVQVALKKKQGGSTENLEAIAIAEAQAFITSWTNSILPRSADEEDMDISQSLLLIYLNDIPTKLPKHFLSGNPPPGEFSNVFHNRILRTVPKLEISSMVPEKIEMGVIHDLADSTIEIMEKWPLLKALVTWFIFILFMLFMFWYTRGRTL